MSSMQDCSFGLRLSENCNLLDFVITAGLKSLSSLEPQEIELLTWRVPGFKFDSASDVNICFHHEQKLLARYSHHQKKCCDPFRAEHLTVARLPGASKIFSGQVDSGNYLPHWASCLKNYVQPLQSCFIFCYAGQVKYFQGKWILGTTCPTGQVVLKVNVQPCHSRNIRRQLKVLYKGRYILTQHSGVVLDHFFYKNSALCDKSNRLGTNHLWDV